MPCSIVLVTGRSGSGKSTYITRRAIDAINSGKDAFLLVPEQFTFETERKIASELGRGFIHDAVFSFTSLASFVLEETGDRAVYLSRQGKRMVIRKAIEDNRAELIAYARVANSAGFTQRCEELFTRFKRFVITPDMLNHAASNEKISSTLAAKLHDLSLIYAASEEYLSTRYLDAEDMVNQLIERLPSSSIRNCEVFIDGFEFLTEQKFRVIQQLMKICPKMTISLCITKNARDAELFEPCYRAYRRLKSLADELGCITERISLERHVDAFEPMLSHMEKELFAWPHEIWRRGLNANENSDQASAIKLFAASNVTAECDILCNEIISAVNEGIRFREMAVITSVPASYNATLMRSLRRFSIPFFMDMPHPLTKHPIAEFMMASLACIVNNYRRQDVISILKTGLLDIDTGSIERFENYVLKYGIEGAARFEAFENDSCTPEIECVRNMVITPLRKLQQGLASVHNVSEKTEKLYMYMDECGIYKSLSILAKRMRDEGRLELSNETAQAWETTMQLLSQMHTILGTCKVSNKRYYELLFEGLSAYSIGIIPTTADQLLVGDITRTCASGIKRLFIIGANEGSFPLQEQDSEIIDDSELAFLNSIGIPVWENSLQRNANNMYCIYAAMCKPTQKLYISYVASTGTGACAAAVVDAIQEIFPNLTVNTDIGGYVTPKHPEMYLSQLAVGLRRFCDTGQTDEFTKKLYGAVASDKKYIEYVESIKRALFFSPGAKSIGKNVAKELYGQRNRGSSSRLETFNSCSFKYFMQYGLYAKPREELRERATDSGTFYHEVMDELIKVITENNVDLTMVTPNDVDAMLEPILNSAILSHNYGILESSGRMTALGMYMCDCARRAAHAMVKQIALGAFRPKGSEISFGDDGVYPAFEVRLDDGTVFSITGSIDRVDYFTHNGIVYVRIIDYKTHGKDFSFGDLYCGVKMQLALYIAALIECDATLCAAGMYYMPIIGAAVEADDDDAKTEDKALTSYRFDGITLDSALVITNTEPVFEKNRSKSPVIGVKLTSDGKYSGKGIVNEKTMQLVIEFAKTKAKNTLHEIMQGETLPSPSVSKLSKPLETCEYCDYRTVCMFDTAFLGCKPRIIRTMTKDEFSEAVTADENNGPQA